MIIRILLLLSLLTIPVYAAPPTRPATYVSQTTIRSADVTNNEVTLYNYLQAGVDTFADGSIINADIASAAAIAYSKLSLNNSIMNSDINTAAAIAYSKLNLSGSIVNADVSASAAIAYSKLNLSGGILNADVNASAAIVDTKLAQITTAGKVSGAALTALSSTPSGAGVIPTANLGTGTANSTKTLKGDGAWDDFGFGVWASATIGSAVQATTDGILVVYADTSGSFSAGDNISIKTDSSNPPTTIRVAVRGNTSSQTNAVNLTCPVKSGDYYLIEDNGGGFENETGYFIPMN